MAEVQLEIFMRTGELGCQGRERLGCFGKARSWLKVAELFFSVEEEPKLSGRAAVVSEAVRVEGRKGTSPFILRGVVVAE